MSCPVCAGTCHCGREDEATSASATQHLAVLVDPEQYAGSEERCAASSASGERPEWRQEIATRVRGFRRRRSRNPDDDSLELDFSAAPSAAEVTTTDVPKALRACVEVDEAFPSALENNIEIAPSQDYADAADEDSLNWQEAKIIEFPRLLDGPAWQSELAEPAELSPRIFEAEDVAQAERFAETAGSFSAADSLPTLVLDAVPTQPAPCEEPVFIETAPLHLRAIAATIDLALVLAAAWLFALVLFEMGAMPAGHNALLLFTVAGFGLWSLYQYLFMMYREGTPGMDATRLVLMSFDQIPPSRQQLRARTWGAILSTLSLGLGFAWAGLDEDTLCWHDRLSRTCLVIPDWP